MADDLNTQTEKALAPIQLYDASGPQPLADERNYRFLQELFDKKAIDPVANYAYNVRDVVQRKNNDLSTYGAFIDIGTIDPNEASVAYKSIYDDAIKNSKKLSDTDKIIYMSEPWNSPHGILTLLHEFRHKAFEENPKLKNFVDKNAKEFANKYKIDAYEEILTRFMDVKYHDDEVSKDWLRNKFNANLYDENKKFQDKIYKDIEKVENILKEKTDENNR